MKTYIVTGSQYGSTVSEDNIALVERYAKYIDAEILVMPANGNYKADINIHVPEGWRFIDKTFRFNKRLQTIHPMLAINRKNPISGLIEYSKAYGSAIVAAPRFDFELASDDERGKPTGVFATGLISEPYYKMHTTAGKLASKSHKCGFVVVQVAGDSFWVTDVEIKHGVAYDRGIRITPHKLRRIKRWDAAVLGDLHLPNYDKRSWKAALEQVDYYRPRKIFLHDVADNMLVNPHEAGSLISQIHNLNASFKTIEEEMKRVYKTLIPEIEKRPWTTFYVTCSNHDDFLRRYIDSKRFIDDPKNVIFGCRLLIEMIDDLKAQKRGEETPILELALRHCGPLPKNIVFLQLDAKEDGGGFESGNHFYKSNGGRAGVAQVNRSLGRCCYAHTHSPARKNDILIAGTNSLLDPRYTQGSLSSWAVANIINHQKRAQHQFSVNGKWCTPFGIYKG